MPYSAEHKQATRARIVECARRLFNRRGLAKLELGLAKGRKKHDKRELEKKRDWQRQKARLMRERG